MLAISKQQALDRWDVLPENLREELVSDVNSNFIWQTCGAEHIPDEKIYTVSKIVGWVLMGFLHPEDMANEMRDALGIDIRIATSIAGTINQRVFAPIRTDIDKVYNPSAGETSMPKIVEEIHPPMAELMPTSVPAVLPIVSIPVAIPTAPKQEMIKPATEKTSFDEFARLGKNSASAPAPAPKPIVLQTESIPRPISNAPNFRIPTIAENVMSGQKGSGQLPTRTAVVEFGGMPIPKPVPASQFSAAPKVTVVRYGSENSAMPAIPPKPKPMRTITEITPETLESVAPIPKAPPQPSFAPLSQIPIPPPIMPKPLPEIPKPATLPEKIVQKDYFSAGK
jgi:hypothetical protein